MALLGPVIINKSLMVYDASISGRYDIYLAERTNFYYNYHEVIEFLEKAENCNNILAFQDLGIGFITRKNVISQAINLNPILLSMLASNNQTQLISLLDKYNISHIILPKKDTTLWKHLIDVPGWKNLVNLIREPVLFDEEILNLTNYSVKWPRTTKIDVKKTQDITIINGSTSYGFMMFNYNRKLVSSKSLLSLNCSVAKVGSDPWSGMTLLLSQGDPAHHYYQIEVRGDTNVVLLEYINGKRSQWLISGNYPLKIADWYELDLLVNGSTCEIKIYSETLFKFQLEYEATSFGIGVNDATLLLEGPSICRIEDQFHSYDLSYYSVYTLQISGKEDSD